MSTQTTATAQKSAAPALTAAPAAALQRQCECGQHALGGECEECRQKRGIFARSAFGRLAPAVPFSFAGASLRAPGQPLDPETRACMESRFHHDFSGVRVHTDDQAAESARALNANAWTLGCNIVFASGRYAPSNPEGRRLLAHELAHVVQQGDAPAQAQPSSLEVSEPAGDAEREANAFALDEDAAIRQRVDRPIIHRDAVQTAIDIGKVVGIIGGSALLAYWIYGWYRFYKGVKALFGSSETCSSGQKNKIGAALDRARAWTKTALERVQAFRARPDAPETAATRAALDLRFRSSTPEVAEKVERVIVQVRRRIEFNPQFECHTESDKTCRGPHAYVPGGNQIIFCLEYFDNDDFRATGDIIHEMTHTLIGGAHIYDRGYQGERMVGGDGEPARFSTEEALSNADSYGEFIAAIATGRSYGKPGPADDLDCPNDWQGVAKDAIARAERAVIKVVQSLRTANKEAWAARWRGLRMPGDPPDWDRVWNIYHTTYDKIGNQIRLVCSLNDNCAHDDTAWSNPPPTITVCPSWKNRPEAERIVQMVAALYGLYVDASDPDRVNLARVAVAAVEAPPSRVAVFGSPLWTPDLLTVTYLTRVPRKDATYDESGVVHRRFSRDLPVYQAPACGKSQLPFRFNFLFKMDSPDRPRPGPVTPPRLSREYRFYGEPALSGKDEDNDPTQGDAGLPLGSTLYKKSVDLTLSSNGILEMVGQLDDPDSRTVRRYCDRISVIAERSCPDPPAPAAPPPAPADPCAAPLPAAAAPAPAPAAAPAPAPAAPAPAPEAAPAPAAPGAGEPANAPEPGGGGGEQ